MGLLRATPDCRGPNWAHRHGLEPETFSVPTHPDVEQVRFPGGGQAPPSILDGAESRSNLGAVRQMQVLGNTIGDSLAGSVTMMRS